MPRTCMDCEGPLHAAFSFVLARDVNAYLNGEPVAVIRERCDWCAAWAASYGGCDNGLPFMWGLDATQAIAARRRQLCERQMQRAGK